MPELPEVETTVRGLRKKVLGRTFIDIWTDAPKIIKRPQSVKRFKEKIKGRKIQKIWRRGKNILFQLSGYETLLVHQKMTGHLLFGKWQKIKDGWRAPPGPLSDKINRFLHLVFTLDNNQMIALSDLRKFAKVELLDNENLKKELDSLGHEPLEPNFTFKRFKTALEKKKQGKIKQILTNQEVIAGIGNIYSDEILFAAKIHPSRRVEELKEKELQRIYRAMKIILKKAIELKGTSISDYRTTSGKKGFFEAKRKVYQKTGEACSHCNAKIKRIKIGGRSAHFCPKCQK